MAKKNSKSNENFDTEEVIEDENVTEDAKTKEVVDDEDTEENTSDEMAENDDSDGIAEDDDSDGIAEDDNQAPDDDSESDDKDKGKGAKKHFKDKKNNHQQIIDELNDKVMRQMAEFENFRKRSEKEKTQMYDMGAKSSIEKILPVVDNFERGLDAAEDGDSFADGMKMIYKQLITALEDMGVKEIEAEGQEFNPEYHNAVMHVDDEELGENVVVEVLQKGYMYNDSVLRHAMVKVAN